MPCYDPPPPWAGREQESAEAAVRLLCDLTQEALAKNIPVCREVVAWFIKHRRIDLTMATYNQTPAPDVVGRIVRDIERAERLLEGMSP